MQRIKGVQAGQGAIDGGCVRRTKRHHAEVVGPERIRIPLRMRVRRAADVARAGIPSHAGAAICAGRRIAGAERLGSCREPDLDVRGGRLNAMAGGQEDGRRQERAGAAPERVAAGILGDHQADIRVVVAIVRAVADRADRRDHRRGEGYGRDQCGHEGTRASKAHGTLPPIPRKG